MPNINKINSEMQRLISSTLLMEVKDTNAKFITITACDVTRDLSYATIYYTCMGSDEQVANSKKALERTKGFLKSVIAKKMNLRKVPELIFVFDESIAYGNKIESILNSLKKDEPLE